MTIASILCAVDFSSASLRLLRAALSVAKREHARVVVLHVLDPLLVQAARIKFEDGLLERSAEEDLSALIADATTAEHGDGTHVERCIRTGAPDEEILAEAAEKGADLVVIGTHGFTGVRRLFFGSTAAGVLGHTHIPVLALPPETATPGTEAGLVPLGSLTRLLVAVDFTDTCMHTVREAATLARRWQLALTLLHAVPAGPRLERWRELLDADQERRVERARYRLGLLAEELSRDRAAVRVVAAGGSPEEVIARVAAEVPGTLVVMGVRDRATLTAAPGSTAYRLLCLTPAPVLVLPGEAASFRGAASAVRGRSRRRI